MRLLYEPSRELPLVRFGVTFLTGCSDEPKGREGLARLCARMLRRGSVRRGAADIEAELERLGAELGVYVGIGITMVRCEALARSLEPAVALLSELVGEPAFSVSELERLERQTDAEIISARDDDAGLAARALRRHLFAGHPHGRRVAGTRAGVAAVTRDDVVAFHRTGYVGAGAVVTVSGDVEPAGAERIAERLTSGLPEGDEPAYGIGEPAPPSGRNMVLVDKPGRTQTQLGIGLLGTHPRDRDHVALSVANTAFGGTFSSPMMQAIRAERGWSYHAASTLTTARIREMFAMWSAPSTTDAPACLALELELLERLVEEGLDDETVGFAKRHIAGAWPFEIDSAEKRLSQKLDRLLLNLPDDYHERWVERVEAITSEQVAAAVRARLDPKHLWISAVGEADGVGADLRAALPDLDDVVVERYDRD